MIRRRAVRIAGAAGLVVLLILTYLLFWPGDGGGKAFYIRTGSTYSTVLSDLQKGGFIRGKSSFNLAAKIVGLPSNIRPGKYRITRGMGDAAIARMLRAGRQEEVKLLLKKVRTKADLAGRLSRELEADSLSVMRVMNDPLFTRQYGMDTAATLAVIFPDTYHFWWNTTAQKAVEKLGKEHTKYWTDARRGKAAALGLSAAQTIIVASIVDEETNSAAEKGTVASVYLNRLRKGMKLQADPTARWAGGDFSIRRVTSKQTGLAHPYNTYYVSGLPPGPICTPSRATVDAVLNAPKTDYLFFCASERFDGTHRFAKTYAEHEANARRYQAELNRRGIR